MDPESFGEGIEGAVDRYVAMTRATQQLVILTSPDALHDDALRSRSRHLAEPGVEERLEHAGEPVPGGAGHCRVDGTRLQRDVPCRGPLHAGVDQRRHHSGAATAARDVEARHRPRKRLVEVEALAEPGESGKGRQSRPADRTVPGVVREQPGLTRPGLCVEVVAVEDAFAAVVRRPEQPVLAPATVRGPTAPEQRRPGPPSGRSRRARRGGWRPSPHGAPTTQPLA